MRTLVTLLSVLTLTACTLYGEPPVGDKAPEINAQKWYNTSGDVTLADLDGIKVVEFWATWCPPCRMSIPHLEKLHKKLADKGVTIIGLTNEKPDEKLEAFIKKMEMTYIVGAGSTSGQEYGVQGIPSAFIVDAEGTILWRGHPMAGMDEELEKLVPGVKLTEEEPEPARKAEPKPAAEKESSEEPAKPAVPAKPVAEEKPAAADE